MRDENKLRCLLGTEFIPRGKNLSCRTARNLLSCPEDQKSQLSKDRTPKEKCQRKYILLGLEQWSVKTSQVQESLKIRKISVLRRRGYKLRKRPEQDAESSSEQRTQVGLCGGALGDEVLWNFTLDCSRHP